MLDINFGEDASRKKAGNAAQNFSVISCNSIEPSSE